MNSTLALIERVRRTTKTHTNYAVAKALEMEQGQLRRVLKGEFGLGNKAVIRIAELCQMDVRDVLVMIEEDKARSPEDKAFWERRSPRISATTVIAAVAFLVAGLGTDARAANTGYNNSIDFTAYTLCEVGV